MQSLTCILLESSSCAGNQPRNVSKKLETELENIRKRHLELVEKCEFIKKGQVDSDAREEALSELKAIEAEMGQYADNDPTTFEAMSNELTTFFLPFLRYTLWLIFPLRNLLS
ncbi:hypothetical protein QVD17_06707 [Tagetes erecta]|uniref:Uncharacterized protein n=1 Tax=Tagetes erecta TaxID=13708 RepID=A0AAD8LNY0_TARER|nr:hypothetical protein QVD17_06707 [Tagetes erecta]